MDRESLRDRVRDITLVGTDDYSDASIDDMLNDALFVIAIDMPWPWLEATATLTSVANQQEYDLPDDIQRLDSILPPTGYMPLKNITLREANRLFGADVATADNATHYATLNVDTVILYPVPNSSGDEYTILYHALPTELLADDDVPQFDRAFHSLISEYASYLLYRREELDTEAARARGEFMLGLRDMRDFYTGWSMRGPWALGGYNRRYNSSEVL